MKLLNGIGPRWRFKPVKTFKSFNTPSLLSPATGEM